MGGSRVLGIGELIRSFATLAVDMKKLPPDALRQQVPVCCARNRV